MNDAEDFILFAAVAEHGGFAAASRAIGVPKSKLSRRMAGLEQRLGARLMERSTRQFRLTAAGATLLHHSRAIILEVERARSATAEVVGEPRGTVRLSCPTGLIDQLSQALPSFLAMYPHVRLHVIAVDRPVDLIAERIDVAIRVRTDLGYDSGLTVKQLGTSRRILVASPALGGLGNPPAIRQLPELPTLSSSLEPGPVSWRLRGPDGQSLTHSHEPRMRCEAFPVLVAAAASGLGVALLPDHVCADPLREGKLIRVGPDWHAEEGLLHLVFTTSRGLPPAVRALIDHLAKCFHLA